MLPKDAWHGPGPVAVNSNSPYARYRRHCSNASIARQSHAFPEYPEVYLVAVKPGIQFMGVSQKAVYRGCLVSCFGTWEIRHQKHLTPAAVVGQGTPVREHHSGTPEDTDVKPLRLFFAVVRMARGSPFHGAQSTDRYAQSPWRRKSNQGRRNPFSITGASCCTSRKWKLN